MNPAISSCSNGARHTQIPRCEQLFGSPRFSDSWPSVFITVPLMLGRRRSAPGGATSTTRVTSRIGVKSGLICCHRRVRQDLKWRVYNRAPWAATIGSLLIYPTTLTAKLQNLITSSILATVGQVISNSLSYCRFG